MPDKPAFRVEDSRGKVLLETDDWVAASRATLVSNWPDERSPLYVRGTHPTHKWNDQRRCTSCGAWNNGSYGSHAPCGFDWSKISLVGALEAAEADQNA